ncbi:hypothetical protein EVA_07579 [gut metagenome]|uniref:Uncharacterized protein n=1 Tax=gut metagenome TaxID=749906 RepID=J9CVR1_9ZZZZ
MINNNQIAKTSKPVRKNDFSGSTSHHVRSFFSSVTNTLPSGSSLSSGLAVIGDNCAMNRDSQFAF